ncbi:MAG: heavy metal-binding domain-containing protein [Piscirickettsiaceae bacterium]|jgi:uncharacterized protein YbjQ (UPF0145 family)|nr:heavy metal-binding domain-containing protein [Piscirickettsiaceae bacterium]
MWDLYFFISLIITGYIFGQIHERRHYASIKRREEETVQMVMTSSKHPMGDLGPIKDAKLVQGGVVISVDYFKRIVTSLRNFFGGNIRGYETLVDRARREAILRLKESCPDATQIINLRLETSSIYKGKGNQIGSVEVLAYATALYT